MNTLKVSVQEIISVAEQFGEQIKRTLVKTVRAFGFCMDATYKILHTLFSSPSMRPRPPTVGQAPFLVKPPNMVIFAVLGGFILL